MRIQLVTAVDLKLQRKLIVYQSYAYEGKSFPKEAIV